MTVIHIVESLGRGAVERWLVEVFLVARRLRPDLQWKFFCTLAVPGEMDKRVEENGGEIIRSPASISNGREFMSGIRNALRSQRCDILHSHHDLMSGIYLLAAVGLPLRKRIIHVHNTSCDVPVRPGLRRHVLRAFCRGLCLRLADDIVGVSSPALQALCGRHMPAKGRVMHCGVDFGAFGSSPSDRPRIRQELGIDEDQKMILFAGRLDAHKNPLFLLEILAHLQRTVPRCVAVFAGEGPLRSAVELRAESLGLSGRIRVLGWRKDLPALMSGSDLLIWPGDEAQVEGLGLVAVEAQAAGLPILVSRNIPTEAFVIGQLANQQAMSSGAEAWSQSAAAILGRARPLPDDCLAQMRKSSFSIENSARALVGLYPVGS